MELRRIVGLLDGRIGPAGGSVHFEDFAADARMWLADDEIAGAAVPVERLQALAHFAREEIGRRMRITDLQDSQALARLVQRLWIGERRLEGGAPRRARRTR